MKSIKAYLLDESGQTSFEYILILAVAAMIVFKFRGVAMQKIGNLTNGIFDGTAQISDQLRQAVDAP